MRAIACPNCGEVLEIEWMRGTAECPSCGGYFRYRDLCLSLWENEDPERDLALSYVNREAFEESQDA